MLWLATVGAGITNSTVAKATFSYVQCPASTWTEVPARLVPTDLDRRLEEPDKMANRQDYSWSLYANPNVNSINAFIRSWDTQSGQDYLRVTDYWGSSDIQGHPTQPAWRASNWVPKSVQSGGTVFSKYLDLRWVTNETTEPVIPDIDRVRVKCSGSAAVANGTTLPFNQRAEGLLIGSGDVVYLQTSLLDSTVPVLLVLDKLAAESDTGNPDFDLYASTTTTTPSDTSYQWRGFTSNTYEAVYIPASYPQTLRRIYLGVHSYRGRGHFAIHALIQNQASRALGTRKICKLNNVALSAPERAIVVDFVREASLRFLSMTQGSIWFNNWQISIRAGSACPEDCALCLTNNPDGPMWSTMRSDCLGVNDIPKSYWQTPGITVTSGYRLAHELAHVCLNVDDEYGFPGTTAWCGHTPMVWGLPTHVAQLCTDTNHCRDTSPPDETCWQDWPQSGWGVANNSAYYNGGDITTTTPDSTLYVDNPNLRNLISITDE